MSSKVSTVILILGSGERIGFGSPCKQLIYQACCEHCAIHSFAEPAAPRQVGMQPTLKRMENPCIRCFVCAWLDPTPCASLLKTMTRTRHHGAGVKAQRLPCECWCRSTAKYRVSFLVPLTHVNGDYCDDLRFFAVRRL